ncbi:MAG: DNA-directed RNA polymerase subunit omega [Epulopiscium sp. Nuni2H_MBin003]|nr:MAG: DNA-directed RNA polymerase subunit omega [Epulopiscium sp. Nuni2H_MBin003]
MLEPSYTQIMNKLNSEANEKVVTSRYSIIIATARRARQIIEVVNQVNTGAIVDRNKIEQAEEFKFQLKTKKATAIAVEELYSGIVKIREVEQ